MGWRGAAEDRSSHGDSTCSHTRMTGGARQEGDVWGEWRAECLPMLTEEVDGVTGALAVFTALTPSPSSPPPVASNHFLSRLCGGGSRRAREEQSDDSEVDSE